MNLIKVSDIIVSQDGCGPYKLVLGGPDASFFRIIDGALYFDKDLVPTTTTTTTTGTTISPTVTTVSPVTTSTTSTTLTPTSTTINPIQAPYGITPYWDEFNDRIDLNFYDNNNTQIYLIQRFDYGTTYPNTAVQQGAKNFAWTTNNFSLQTIDGQYRLVSLYNFNESGGWYQWRVASIVNGVTGQFGYSDVLFAGTTTTTEGPINNIELTALPFITCAFNENPCARTFSTFATLTRSTGQTVTTNIPSIIYRWYTSTGGGLWTLRATNTKNSLSDSFYLSSPASIRCVATVNGLSAETAGYLRPGSIA